MKENDSTPEILAHMELKGKIVQLMFDFIDQYSGKDNPNNLYPKVGYILVDVLTSCLSEAQNQVTDYHPLTSEQVDHICHFIGDLYLEKIKNMICKDE